MNVLLTDSELRLELTPLERLLAVHGSFGVTRSHITTARVVRRAEATAERGVRMPGTQLFSRLAFGTWRRLWRDKQFWAVRRADRVLVVDLRDERYDRLVLEVPDPDRIATELTRSDHVNRRS